MQIFNDGLKQALRLSFQKYEVSRRGTTPSVLQEVKTDAGRFINALVTVLFSYLVGTAFNVLQPEQELAPSTGIFVGVIVLGSLTGLLSKRIKTIQRSINRRTDAQAGIITESLRNVELVKSPGLTFAEIRESFALSVPVSSSNSSRAILIFPSINFLNSRSSLSLYFVLPASSIMMSKHRADQLVLNNKRILISII